MRSKKAQVLEIAIVFIFLAMIIFLYGNTSKDKEVMIVIGDKQYQILDSYMEAEKAREFVMVSAELATLQANDIGTGDNCFKDVAQGSFKQDFENNMAKYLIKYKSTTENLSVILPTYSYTYDIQPSEITVQGYSSGDIEVTGENIDYKADPYFKQIVDCNKKTLLIGVSSVL
jgi:hypothetical protein